MTKDSKRAGSLARRLAEGRAAWPQLALRDEDFLAQAERHLEADEDAEGLTFAADLFLACACANAVPGAAEAFLAEYDRRILGALRRLTLPEHARDELIQCVRHKLVVGEKGRGPQLARYAGRGPLGAWVRIVALRVGQDSVRRPGPERADDELLANRAAAGDDPEMEVMKGRYRDAFRRAVRESLVALEPRQRNLLRYRYVDGLGPDAIAGLHAVHRATAARWLATARERLLDQAQQRMMSELGVDKPQLESVIRLIGSRLHVTLPELFADGGADDQG